MRKSLIVCAALGLLLAGCCGWPCNRPDPPQPPGTRIVRAYGVHVDGEVLEKIADGEMQLNEASQLWHQNRSITIYFDTAASSRDLAVEGLTTHFIEDGGLFVMAGTGRITFDRTIIEISDRELIIKVMDEDGEIISETPVIYYASSQDICGFSEMDNIEQAPADAGDDSTPSPPAFKKSRVVKEITVTKRLYPPPSSKYMPLIIDEVYDLTVRPDGTWWEGVGFHAEGGCPEEK